MPAFKNSNSNKAAPPADCEISYVHPDKPTLLLKLMGSWTIAARLPDLEEAQKHLQPDTGIRRISFDTDQVAGWDSALLTFLIKLEDYCRKSNIAFIKDGLPQGVDKLLSLAAAVPERKGARKTAVRESIFERIGASTISLWQSNTEILSFIGEASIGMLKFMAGKASFRRRDLAVFIQDCGVSALPIVSLISFLVGLILAFIGAVQLAMFGAQIFVANLVGIAMLRVMGAVMVGVVMSGRTGAAFAAQLGTMQVNEEIDALKTMGISPMEFLVIPRLVAMIIMMPLLCIYADLMGVLGGLVVGVGLLDIGLIQYLNQTQAALNLHHFFIGLFQAGVFGVLVALTGCLRGMQCGRSASAVGDATTSAVVTSIVAMVIATAIVTLGCNFMGI